MARKFDNPCLSFEIESSENRVCTVHDFPVTLIPRKRWQAEIREPPSVGDTPADVCLYMPDIRRVRHLAEKYKSLGSQVVLTVSREGQLKFCMSNERVELTTYFKNLEVPRDGSVRLMGNADTDADIEASVKIDIKKLSILLGVDINFRKTLASFIDKKTVHMFHLDEDLCLQYIIPAAVDD